MSDQQAPAVRVTASDESPGDVDATPGGEEGQTGLDPTSILAGFTDRLRKFREEIHVDLEVPRYREEFGFPVFVRYVPTEQARVEKFVERRLPKPGEDSPEVTLKLNADVLAACCRGIFTVLPNGERMGLDAGDPGHFHTFSDPRLGELLPPRSVNGVPVTTVNAVELVRRLYITDGDLNGAADALGAFSGKESIRADKDFPTP
jgi:hypothetical protein